MLEDILHILVEPKYLSSDNLVVKLPQFLSGKSHSKVYHRYLLFGVTGLSKEEKELVEPEQGILKANIKESS